MAATNVYGVQLGDKFEDLDDHIPDGTPRIVKVVSFKTPTSPSGPWEAEVENVEHWDEELIGRSTTIQVSRLKDNNLFKKVSH